MRNSFRTKAKVLMVFVLIFTLVLGGIPGVLASNNLWYDKYTTLEGSIGGNFYTSTMSDIFAWSESYILRSYVTMYNQTGDTAWLNKFTTHVDTMVSNANDNDGDGYLSWDTFSYSNVEIGNGDMEAAASGDSTRPDLWTRFQSTSTTAYRSSTVKCNGSYGLVVKTNGTTWQKIYQPMGNYEPNTRYVFRLNAKTNGSPARGRAYVYDKTAGAAIAEIIVDNTSWQYYSVEFTTPSVTGHQLEIWLGHQYYSYTGGEADYDDVSVSARYPYLVHDGMVGTAMAEFVRLIHKTPALQAAYLTKADSYESFLVNELIPKWESSSYLGNCWVNVSSSQGYYILPPNMYTTDTTSAGRTAPHNFNTAMGHMFIILWDVTGNDNYRIRARQIATNLKNCSTVNGTAYVWYYRGSSDAKEDTSHGAIDVGFMNEMYNYVQIVNGTDMDRYTSALVDYMWNKSTTAPTVSEYIDGTGDRTSYTRTLWGWLELNQFNKTVWTIAAEQFRNYTPTTAGNLLALSQIMKWDPEKITNQGFELMDRNDNTLPARWVRWQSTSTTCYRDSADKMSGAYSLILKTNGTTWQKAYQVWEKWTPGATYIVEFDAKTNGSAAGGKVSMYDETTGASLGNLAFTNTTWQHMSFTFTAPANASDSLRLYLAHNAYAPTNGYVWFDNVKVKRSGDSW